MTVHTKFREFTPYQYLAMDIANNYGLDKETHDFKLNWFEQNKDNLLDLLPNAEEKPLFVAGIQAYEDFLANKPSGYPISLDAVASGMQILSVLGGCHKSAELCGVVNNKTGERPNPYKSLYERMCNVLGISSRIAYEHVKKAIMTSLYGSVKAPLNLFGEQNYEVFKGICATHIPIVWKLNNLMQTLHSDKALIYKWVMPDNFHVITPVNEVITERVRFDDQILEVNHKVNKATKYYKAHGANITHSVDGLIVREIVGRCSYDTKHINRIVNAIESKSKSSVRHKDVMLDTLWKRYKEFNFLSVRILDYLDEQNMGNIDASVILKLLQTLPKKRFDVLTIHDCFRVLPAYGNDIRRQYNQILYEIHNSNILKNCFSYIARKPSRISKYANFGSEILEANYSLC